MRYPHLCTGIPGDAEAGGTAASAGAGERNGHEAGAAETAHPHAADAELWISTGG